MTTRTADRNFSSYPNHSGRKTFDFILSQVGDCLHDIAPFFQRFSAEQIYTPEYLKIANVYKVERPDIDLVQLAHSDLAYSIAYFGVSHKDLTTLNRIFDGKYNQVYLSYLSFFIKNKPHPDSGLNIYWESFVENHLGNIIDRLYDITNSSNATFTQNPYKALSWYSNLPEVKEILGPLPYKYFGGHQFKLGHYYRHLYQSVNYINEQKLLKYPEKYEYIKTLRAQLSIPEQYLLFFNTISSIGRAWEFNQLTDKPFLNVNSYLITKYNLIKNIPDTFFLDLVNINNYYPLINFEFSTNSLGRARHLSKFR